MNNQEREHQKWKALAQQAMGRLSQEATKVIAAFAANQNDFAHLNPAAQEHALKGLDLTEEQTADAIDELEEFHLIRYSGKSGFIQLNPNLWTPSAESTEWAYERWASNMTEAKKEELNLRRIDRPTGGKHRPDPSGIAE